MKVEGINNEAGRLYVQTWLNALQRLLGWSEKQTLKWAEKWESDLNNPDCLFFHEPPSYYFVSLLIPESLNKGLSGAERAMLKRAILGVIENTDSFHYYKNPTFDWKLAKRRVETFLDEVKRQKQTSKRSIDAFLLEHQRRISDKN